MSSQRQSRIPTVRTVNTRTNVDPNGTRQRITTVTETFATEKKPAPSRIRCPVGRYSGSGSGGTRPSYGIPQSRISNPRANMPKVGPCGCPGKKTKQPDRPAYGPAPRPDDYLSPAGPSVQAESSLERLVSEELLERSYQSPGRPVQAQSFRKQITTPPVVMTPEGPKQGTHQMSMVQSVERWDDTEYIKKNLSAIEAAECGCATKYEMSKQNMQPGGINATVRSGPVMPVHETISVETSLTAGPDTNVRTHSVVCESVQPRQLSETEVTQMVEEEYEDVENISHLQPPELKAAGSTNFGLKKRLQKMRFNPEAVKQLESSVVYPPVTADEAQEETQPELLAAIMHTEEQGLNMDSVPTNVYNYLFPDVKDDLLIAINPVVPGVLQNVVVPISVPSEIHVHGVTPELECAAAEATQCGRRRPPKNLFAKLGAIPEINNTALRGKTKEIVGSKQPFYALASEEPPWQVEDIQPIINLVGAVPLKAIPTDDMFEVPAFYHEMENVLEYHLIPEPPQHVSRVQLRGSQKPSWFPGYYMALPDKIKVVKTPCEVLPAAWEAVQPDIFSDDSFLIVG